MNNATTKEKKERVWIKVLQHTTIWLLVFALPYIMRYNYDNRFRNEIVNSGFFWVDNITKLFWVVTFYLNAYWLTTKFVYRKKYLQYAGVLLVMLVAIALCHELLMTLFDSRKMPGMRMGKSMVMEGGQPFKNGQGKDFGQPQPPRTFNLMLPLLFNLPAFLLTIAASIAYRTINDKSRSDALAQQKQEETLKTELSFLRSQISPHFVFNILNNITALARLKSDELEPTVIKLSSLMRYMLYETNEAKVAVKTEAEYLQSYIELQSQRFGKKVKVEVNMDQVTDNYRAIEPMLLIPFVENAFKHGIGLVQEPHIIIQLTVQDDMLNFEVRNKFLRHPEEIKDKASGIGLVNVRRRLNLLYEQSHRLEIKETTEHQQQWFEVSLQIKLQP